MDNKRQSAVWAVRNLGFIKQRIGRKGAQCVLYPAVTVICPSVVYNNIRLIGISAAEERPRDIRQHGWWHVPVPGKPCAGQRLFISGRRKVNARTRRGGERPALRRNRNPIAPGLPCAARRTDGRTGGGHRRRSICPSRYRVIDAVGERYWSEKLTCYRPAVTPSTGWWPSRARRPPVPTSGRWIAREETTTTTFVLRPVITRLVCWFFPILSFTFIMAPVCRQAILFCLCLFDTHALITQTAERRPVISIPEMWSWAELVKFIQTFRPPLP